MNDADIADLFLLIKSEWGDKFNTSEDRMDLWRAALSNLNYEEAKLAVAMYLRAGTPFPPRPSDLLDQIAASATRDLDPESAWEEVMAEVRRVGLRPTPIYVNGTELPAPKPEFSSPIVAQAVRSIGWENLCTSNVPGALRVSFVKTMTNLVERHRRNIKIEGLGAAESLLQLSTAPRATTRMTGNELARIGEIDYDPEAQGL